MALKINKINIMKRIGLSKYFPRTQKLWYDFTI